MQLSNYNKYVENKASIKSYTEYLRYRFIGVENMKKIAREITRLDAENKLLIEHHYEIDLQYEHLQVRSKLNGKNKVENNG